MPKEKQAKSIIADTLNYDHVIVKPSEQIGLHHSNSWELSSIVIGRGTRILGDSKEEFKEGEIVLIVPNMSHQWCFDPKTTDKNGNIENITISFKTDFLEQLALIIPEYRKLAAWYAQLDTSIKFEKSECDNISILLRRMEFEQPDERINTLLLLLTEICHSNRFVKTGHFVSSTTLEDKIKKVKIYIKCNYQHRITIEDIAKHINMNRSSLCIQFRKNTGQTIFDYLTELRIGVAKHLLESENGTIADCCYKSGFNDIPHFNRVFKKYVKMSPSEYRKGLSDK